MITDKTKPTLQGLRFKEKQFKEIQDYKQRLSVLRDGKNTDFWKALKKNLEIVIEGSTIEVDSILSNRVSVDPVGDAYATRLLVGQKKLAKELIDNVENVDNIFERTEDKIEEISLELDQYRRNFNQMEGR